MPKEKDHIMFLGTKFYKKPPKTVGGFVKDMYRLANAGLRTGAITVLNASALKGKR